MMYEEVMTTQQKALALNLDKTTYGAFAEIGAGQEVARWFFHVGGAAGTVAKSISAYDMAVSDTFYGKAQRYVSRQRLKAMLEHEFTQIVENLGATRGNHTAFFAFADTVATRSYSNPGNGRGWVGIRFQTRPGEAPSEIIVHIELLDSTAERQQEALGILGVNLIYGAFHCYQHPTPFILSLMHGLSRERIEIDLIKFSGAAFENLDNRLMSLQLVEQGLTEAAMFTANGEVVQPSEVLYKKPILVQRGSFRPATKLTLDMLERAREQFLQEPTVLGKQPVVLAEMTLRSLESKADVCHKDFLARASILAALGFDVLISRFEPYYLLAEYLTGYTDEMIGIALGLPSIRQVADEVFFTDLPGGVLESTGRLFKRSVKMYVYPACDPETGEVYSVEREIAPPPWHHLRNLLVETRRLEAIRGYNESLLMIQTPDVLARIESGDSSWEAMVPETVAEIIKTKNLFGWQAPTVPSI